jgi:stress-induced morphogen
MLDEIRAILIDNLPIESIDIIDNSYQHKGHAGYTGGISHIKIVITSTELTEMPPLARTRKINSLLTKYFDIIHSIEVQVC